MKKLALLLFPLLGCEKSIDKEHIFVKNAKIIFKEHSPDGCGWLIQTNKDTFYPVNLNTR